MMVPPSTWANRRRLARKRHSPNKTQRKYNTARQITVRLPEHARRHALEARLANGIERFLARGIVGHDGIDLHDLQHVEHTLRRVAECGRAAAVVGLFA